MKFYAEISKRDEERRMVWGYASTEALDSQGERITRAAIDGALSDYMKFANVREMHQPSAVGITKEAEMTEKGLFIGVKVVDNVAWEKVKEGVYKGFSIGGKALGRDDTEKNTITALRLTEISLVDRPANPEALFELWKGDSMSVEMTKEQAVEELADLLTKGAVDPVELLKMAKGEKPAEEAKEEDKEEAKEEDKKEAKEEDKEEAKEEDKEEAKEEDKEEAKEEDKEEAKEEDKPAEEAKAEDAPKGEPKKEEKPAEEAREEVDEKEKEKSESAEDLKKAGKSISAANLEKIQAMHDNSVHLGAVCKACSPEKELSLSEKSEDIAKAEFGELLKSELAKAAEIHSAEISKFEASISALNEEIAKMAAKVVELEKAPAQPKGSLMSFSKAEDVSDGSTEKKEASDAISEIKKMHKSGGVRFV